MRVSTPAQRSLDAIRSDLAGQSGRVVLGTGCFDIMHVGHLYFLEQASKQGDVLVVGVNSDASVRELKGPTRPLVSEHDRASMVAALRCVDHVFVYDEAAADEQIRALVPDVYVTGAESVDAYPTELAAARDVGAAICVIDRVPNRSTSLMVDAVLRRGGDGSG
jgi:rfaE bifunctional protein nucleotidyltransferase chain/domain